MRAIIRKVSNPEEEQVVIQCVEVTQEAEDILAYALSRGSALSGLSSKGQMQRFALCDVLYFEAIDEKVFAYTKDQVYEVRMRLYEAERAYEKQHFVRCSKSVVLNLMQLSGISPALAGRFYAHMKNGERLIISRQYAGRLRSIVMGGGREDEA